MKYGNDKNGDYLRFENSDKIVRLTEAEAKELEVVLKAWRAMGRLEAQNNN